MEEEKMFELLTSVKNMVKTDPAQARAALSSHPNLAYALMKEMVVLDVVDPEVLTRTLQAATGAPPQTQPPQPQPFPPSNGTPSYPPYPPSGSTPTYPTPQSAPFQQPPSSTPSYATPTFPSTSTPSYPPSSGAPYPPTSTPTYPPNYPPQPPQTQPQAPSIPPHMYQARQPPQQPTPPVQSRAPPSAPPPSGLSAVPGLAPEQQAMVQRLALLTPDQIAALPPADRAALVELRRQLGLE